MPSTPIIIIAGSGGGGSPRSVNQGTSYAVNAGDSVQNTATSGLAAKVDYTTGGTTTRLYLDPQETEVLDTAGSIVVP